jgi:anthranilate phosphoribosyltransferase
MLAMSKISDLLAGRLTDQLAYECLLKLSNEKPSAALINEFITNILQTNNYPLLELFAEQTDVIDCCGTGGSGIAHYNTSTSVAFVLAAGGLRVAKFGNRAASGTSGSFDFLECLGIPTISAQEDLLNILERTSLVFLFAPQFYPSLAKLAPIRKAVGKRTILNLIGPLLNPLHPSFRIIGVPTSIAQQAIADYLFLHTTSKKALVVHSDSGLDELDPSSNNSILAVGRLGISKSNLNTTLNDEKQNNHPLTPQEIVRLFKEMISDFFSSPNYFRSLVTLNAGAGFFAAGKTRSIEEGQELATKLLSSGEVLSKYEQCRSMYAQQSR